MFFSQCSFKRVNLISLTFDLRIIIFSRNRNSDFNRNSGCIDSKSHFELTNLIFNISKITFMKRILSILYENEHIEQLLIFFILINIIKTSFTSRFVTKSNKNCFVEAMRSFFRKIRSIVINIVFDKFFLIIIINRTPHATTEIIIFISNTQLRQIMR